MVDREAELSFTSFFLSLFLLPTSPLPPRVLHTAGVVFFFFFLLLFDRPTYKRERVGHGKLILRFYQLRADAS